MNNVNLIREYREHAGLTQEHLGNKVGVSRQTIAAWEKNASELSVLQLAKLAKALGIALDLLLAFPSKEEKENQLMFRADAPEYLTASLQRLLTKKLQIMPWLKNGREKSQYYRNFVRFLNTTLIKLRKLLGRHETG